MELPSHAELRTPSTAATAPSDDAGATVEFNFTLISTDRGSLSKCFQLDEHGNVQRLSSPEDGKVDVGWQTRQTTTLRQLACDMLDFQPNEGMMHTICSVESSRLVSQGRQKAFPDSVTRTKGVFFYPENAPGLGMFDYDPCSQSPYHLSYEQWLEAMELAAPCLHGTTHLMYPSTSSGIRSEVTGKPYKSETGFHDYRVCQDASDFPRFLKVIGKKLWLAGYGYIYLTKNRASMLPRTIVDLNVTGTERIDYCAPAKLLPGVTQDPRDPEYFSGLLLDTKQLQWTDEEEERYLALVATAKALAEPRAASIRNKSKQIDVEKAMAAGLSVEEAQKRAEERYANPDMPVLYPHVELVNPHTKELVTVRQLLDDPEKYDGDDFCDPDEPEYDGWKACAKFYANIGNGQPVINSFAHGGVKYILMGDAEHDFAGMCMEGDDAGSTTAGPTPEKSVLPDANVGKALDDFPRGFSAYFGRGGGTYCRQIVKDRPAKGKCVDFREVTKTDEEGNEKRIGYDAVFRIAGPIEIVGRAVASEDDEGKGLAGVVLKIQDNDHRIRQIHVKMATIHSKGGECITALADHGLHLELAHHQLVKEYLNAGTEASHRILAVSRQGWINDTTFALGNRVYGSNDPVYIPKSPNISWDSKGTTESWKENVGKKCVRNPLMAFAVSLAFAGPLLRPLDQQALLFSAFGASTRGKTTAALAGVTVYGPKSNAKSCESTANAVESTAVKYNDLSVLLDETSRCDPKALEQMLYKLASGHGKDRLKQDMSDRTLFKWRCAFMFTGEKTVEQELQRKGIKVKAGQLVRFLQFQIDGEIEGTWGDLHGFESAGAFANYLLDDAYVNNYGTAGPVYLEWLVKQSKDMLKQRRKDVEDDLLARLAADGIELTAQEERGMRSFAIVALAGELATSIGVTGWPAGYATEAVYACFKNWVDSMPKVSNKSGAIETGAILKSIRTYIQKYGSLRFEKTAPADTAPRALGECSGWVDEFTTTWRGCYLFHSAGLKQAVSGEYSVKTITKALSDSGWLVCNSETERRSSIWVDGRKESVYAVRIPEDTDVE